MRFKLFGFLQRRPDHSSTVEQVSMPPAMQPAPEMAEEEHPPALSPPVFRLIGHVAGIGDRGGSADGWVGLLTGPNHLEGFLADCDVPAWHEHVTFQALQPDGNLGAPVQGGQYCGTRGRSIALHGFVMNVAPDAAAFSDIFYEGLFTDGFRSGLLKPGDWCVSPEHAKLLAMRITTDPNAAEAAR